MEAEARAILTAAVAEERSDTDLFSALTERFAQLGGAELDIRPGQESARRERRRILDQMAAEAEEAGFYDLTVTPKRTR
ncbi:hypothetical protein [Micromonospora sp. Llam0]|uniref:hypothetical protein n=1 Tax=Micromonospora sp. Llam0 TaxID=2485143 RepID=UPI001F46CA28|nr:hypothetical protein [Micromonospora sp. Llam0]